MTAPNSRYANVGEDVFNSPEGVTVVYLRRRLLPDPAQVRGALAAMRPGERADLVAARALGNPTQFHRLCDANGLSDPFEVAEDGQKQIYLPGQQAPIEEPG
jgi:hypothetical protein